jgi:hypothetical protein
MRCTDKVQCILACLRVLKPINDIDCVLMRGIESVHQLQCGFYWSTRVEANRFVLDALVLNRACGHLHLKPIYSSLLNAVSSFFFFTEMLLFAGNCEKWN